MFKLFPCNPVLLLKIIQSSGFLFIRSSGSNVRSYGFYLFDRSVGLMTLSLLFSSYLRRLLLKTLISVPFRFCAISMKKLLKNLRLQSTVAQMSVKQS